MFESNIRRPLLTHSRQGVGDCRPGRGGGGGVLSLRHFMKKCLTDRLSVSLFGFPFLSLPGCVSDCLTLCLTLSVCRSLYLSAFQNICLPTYLSFSHALTFLSPFPPSLPVPSHFFHRFLSTFFSITRPHSLGHFLVLIFMNLCRSNIKNYGKRVSITCDCEQHKYIFLKGKTTQR